MVADLGVGKNLNDSHNFSTNFLKKSSKEKLYEKTHSNNNHTWKLYS